MFSPLEQFTSTHKLWSGSCVYLPGPSSSQCHRSTCSCSSLLCPQRASFCHSLVRKGQLPRLHARGKCIQQKSRTKQTQQSCSRKPRLLQTLGHSLASTAVLYLHWCHTQLCAVSHPSIPSTSTESHSILQSVMIPKIFKPREVTPVRLSPVLPALAEEKGVFCTCVFLFVFPSRKIFKIGLLSLPGN